MICLIVSNKGVLLISSISDFLLCACHVHQSFYSPIHMINCLIVSHSPVIVAVYLSVLKKFPALCLSEIV